MAIPVPVEKLPMSVYNQSLTSRTKLKNELIYTSFPP